MSWISICMVLVCILTALSGYRRGFVKTVVSMISFMVIVLLVAILNPLLSNVVYEYTDIDEKTKAYCIELFAEEADQLGRNEQIALIQKLPLPDALKEDIQENNNNVIYTLLDSSGFGEYIAFYMARLFLRVVIFVLSVVLALLLVWLIRLIVNGLAQMPVLSLLNRLGGFCVGAGKGLLVIWIIFLLVTLMSGTAFGGYMYGQIEEDIFANLMYENNPLVWLLVVFLLA